LGGAGSLSKHQQLDLEKLGSRFHQRVPASVGTGRLLGRFV
jgi:hypothetical protein